MKASEKRINHAAYAGSVTCGGVRGAIGRDSPCLRWRREGSGARAAVRGLVHLGSDEGVPR